MKYTTNLGTFTKGYVVTKNVPLDARLVQSTKNDLFDKTSFTISGLGDCRYEGMLVTVVDDTDVNNGVYLLIDESNKNNEAGWQKLLSLPPKSDFQEGDEIALKYDPTTHDFKWAKITPSGSGSGADKLEDLTDVDISNIEDGQVLTYDSTEGKWKNVTPSGSGSGGDAVTTEPIDYSMLFEPTNIGGLGYTERGTGGTGMGWLKKNESWQSCPTPQSTTCLIPQGTSYQEIFTKILEGDASATATASNYTTTYNGLVQSYVTTLINKPASWTISGYGTSASGPWSSTIPSRKDYGTDTFCIRLLDGNNQEHVIENVKITINKASVNVTPVLQPSTIELGESITFSSNSPTYSGLKNSETIDISGFSGNKYQMNNIEYTEGSPVNAVGSQTIKISNALKSYLNSSYSNYTFNQSSASLTVKAKIKYKTAYDNDWMNYITSLSGFNPYTLITSDFPGLVATSDGYMIPFIHLANNPFKLRIASPYKLNQTDMLFFDSATNTWKPKTSGQYSGFGTPQSISDGTTTWNEYTYSGVDSTNPLAIKITLQ